MNDSATYQLERLANRPDVKAAEYALKAQMAQVDVARAAFYPQLTISASAGWTNNVGETANDWPYASKKWPPLSVPTK